ncbi:MAG: SDR family NAD(P)-dependent oxidoreductase, partial [Actinomycetota bacterium]
MDLGIKGKRAAIAAGTAGLGLGTAIALADAGCDVVVCGRSEERLSSAIDAIGHGARGFVCDVSTDAGGREFVLRSIDMLGGVDILVANGGGPPPGGFASIDEARYVEALQQKMLSSVALCTGA